MAEQSTLSTPPPATGLGDKARAFVAAKSAPSLADKAKAFLSNYHEKRNAPIKKQQSVLRSGIENASRFQENLPQYIAQEASHLRKGISQKLADTTGQIRGGANSRGMLFSGRRMADEGKAQQMAGAEYASGLGGIVSGANEQALGMMADPLASAANINEARDATSSYLNRAAQARTDATNALRNNYIGMIGSGVGTYMGGQSDPNKTPKTTVLGANNYNTGAYA